MTPELKLKKQDIEDIYTSIFFRAAAMKKINPRASKRLWKLCDKLESFLEAIPATKGK